MYRAKQQGEGGWTETRLCIYRRLTPRLWPNTALYMYEKTYQRPGKDMPKKSN